MSLFINVYIVFVICFGAYHVLITLYERSEKCCGREVNSIWLTLDNYLMITWGVLTVVFLCLITLYAIN